MSTPPFAREPQHDKLSLQERIRRRAFQLYVERGSQPGSELDDWLRAEANHSFWWVQDITNKEYITEGGPSGTCPTNCGYLTNFNRLYLVTNGSGSGYYPQDTSGASTQWSIDSTQSQNVCTNVAQLENNATSWNQTEFYYVVGNAPNSNTYAHTIGTQFSPTQPPSTPGW